MGQLYHLAVRADWVEAQRHGEYRMSTRGCPLDQVGFVHCALAEQLDGVAARYYADLPDDDLVVLVLDRETITAPVRHEAAGPGGERFPHVYGAIPLAAVRAAEPVRRDASGRVVPPG